MMIKSYLKKSLLTVFLSAAGMIPVMAQFSKTQAVFTMHITNRAVQQDAAFTDEMCSSLSGRLAKVYPDKVQASDLVIKGDQIELRLKGKIDTALVKKILNNTVDLNFYGGYQDAPKVIAELKAKDTQKLLSFPPAEVTKSLTYLGILQYNDTAAVRQLTKTIVLPAGLRWYFVVKPINTVELYLLNVAQPIITSEQVRHTESYFELREHPGDKDFNPQLMIVLNESGRVKFSQYTRAHLMEMLAIVTHDDIIMSAIITSEINEGSMLINGGNDVTAVDQLLDKIGYPFPATIRVIKCVAD